MPRSVHLSWRSPPTQVLRFVTSEKAQLRSRLAGVARARAIEAPEATAAAVEMTMVDADDVTLSQSRDLDVGPLFLPVSSPEKKLTDTAANSRTAAAEAEGKAEAEARVVLAAEAEAGTLAEARVQSLAITVDKVKYLLRQQLPDAAAAPPLQVSALGVAKSLAG